MLTCDVAVIGGGVVGCMVARELARYKLDICVLERANDVGKGSSKANSGLIHPGFHARGGTLKGRGSVEGNAAYTQLARELDVPFQRIGGLYCAFGPRGLERVKDKQRNAAENGAGVLSLISGDEARQLEPRLSSEVIAALWCENAGIISPFELVIATAQNAAVNGVQFLFNAQVTAVRPFKGKWALELADGTTVAARYVVNAAGDQAAVLDAFVHRADLVIKPKLGQYFVFEKQGVLDAPAPIRHVLYQSAEDDEGGTLLTPTIDGNLLAGPTSDDVRDFTVNRTTAQGLAHVRRVAEKLVPDLQMGRVIANFSGLRANIVNLAKEQKDFIVRASAPGFVSLLGIKNPGMTCAPVLAARAVALLEREGLELEANSAFDPCRKRPLPFLQCDGEAQQCMLAADPGYGHVLCRCEGITEGDVKAALAGPLPPVDVEGLKHRLRVTMGRCQGGFCKPRIQALLDGAPSATAEKDAVRDSLPDRFDVIVVGGGAAGMSAAVAARHAGASVLLLERDAYLGGVLPQCIHDGFGMYNYRENLTGPQYAERWEAETRAAGVVFALDTNVTQVEASADGFAVSAVGVPLGGLRSFTCTSLVMATGCRETTRGQLRIPGTRPEGVYTAGTAQYMTNIEHVMPGSKVVILGGGDIGLIMARRMTLNGAQVRLLVAKEATGLVRNHRRCIDAYGIPTRYGWGVASIHGNVTLKGVKVAPFGPDGTLDLTRAEYVRCNTLLISCGLVPQRELFEQVENEAGLFVCGNAESVHDLVDRVTVEALQVGVAAAARAGKSAPLPQVLQEMSQLRIAELPVGETRKDC